VATKRRQRTIKNLTFAYQEEKSLEEITRLAKRVFHEIAETAVDTAIRLFKDEDLQKGLLQGISVEGAHHLNEALKRKKGVICIGTHLGSFLLLARMLSLAGYPCIDVVKEPDNPISAEVWRILRRQAGIQCIPAQPKIKAVSDSLKWLKEGGFRFSMPTSIRETV
jgi:KDO2-lipid IV(A) lauroyltransferase